jgi:hypothetical protein
MAIILLAILLIIVGLQRIFAQFSTATINIIVGVCMIIDGVLFLIGR